MCVPVLILCTCKHMIWYDAVVRSLERHPWLPRMTIWTGASKEDLLKAPKSNATVCPAPGLQLELACVSESFPMGMLGHSRALWHIILLSQKDDCI